MTRSISLAILLGAGALIAGLAAVFLEPFRDLAFVTAYIKTIFKWMDHPPIVVDQTRDITYIGVRAANSSVEHFHNIFYAHDTSGANRFAPPVPLIPAPGTVIDATTPGAWCPQITGAMFPFTSRVTNISENCLSLRIARPRGLSAAGPDARPLLPVMVWLHGGGHALGSGADELYAPDGLVAQAAADGRPLVFVAVNYRLGLLGFATSEALRAAGHTNAGLRDQRAALQWVRDNIAWFGGDAARVTAVGQGAGAGDVGLQMMAWGGEPRDVVPFQQAVLMSGSPGLNFNTRSRLVEDNTAVIAWWVGCVREGDDGQTVEVLRCLRRTPLEDLLEWSTRMREVRPPFGEGHFYPIYDRDFLPGRPSELVRAGRIAKNIPIIAAWVTNDGAWYPPPTTSTDEEVLGSFGLWLTGLSRSTRDRLLELYPVSDFKQMTSGPGQDVSPQYYRAAQLCRDLWFTCPAVDFAWQYGRHNGRNVRLYEHNATRYGPAFAAAGVPMWRVAHLSDIPYVLNSQQVGGGADNSAEQLALAKEVSQRIAAFVTSGVPDAEWPMAFEDPTDGSHDEYPGSLSLQLFGSPYGNRPVTVHKMRNSQEEISATDAEEAVRREKLFERCEFINSPKVRKEIGG